MQTNLQTDESRVEPLPRFHRILLAVDSSDHANRGVTDGIALAGLSSAEVTAAHVYAAQMHDMRFRQMEGGLPEKYREEQELERQRDVHDDLITRGLSIIADSYMDPVETACRDAGVRFKRRSLEGKNYRQLVQEANNGDYDLLVLGALGLGATPDSRIGTVCERVVRRAKVDTLVIKSPDKPISKGPIVAAVDGSVRAYGGLLTALSLAEAWQVPLHVISAFDPYYHYVAFNRIADGLSEEAGKIFRFQEQEKLHEEIIDSGLAKIYAGHLRIAEQIASDYGLPIETKLLDGKPQDAIGRFVQELQPSLLVMGKLGIHADDDLDIGGNAENLLRNVPCAVMLSQFEFQPQIERVADVSISWTYEAQERLLRAPDFVQNMARMAILRYAQERGHTVVTERIVEEATASLMPGRAGQMMENLVSAHEEGILSNNTPTPAISWTTAALSALDRIDDASLRDNIRLRAEKKARGERAAEVTENHVRDFLNSESDPANSNPDIEPQPEIEHSPLHWGAEALARLARVPEGFMRDACRQRVEEHAYALNAESINLELVEQGLKAARQAMAEQMSNQTEDRPDSSAVASKCPFARLSAGAKEKTETASDAVDFSLAWSEQAQARLLEVPAGYCRNLTQRAVETLARQNDVQQVDVDFVEGVLKVFKQGSQNAETTMPWSQEASGRIARAPDSVRGMLQQEIENWARNHGLEEVDERAVRAIKREWQSRGVFHLESGDPRGEG